MNYANKHRKSLGQKKKLHIVRNTVPSYSFNEYFGGRTEVDKTQKADSEVANKDTSSECSNNVDTYSIKASVDKNLLITEQTVVVKRFLAQGAEVVNAVKRKKSPTLAMLMPKSVEKTDKVFDKNSDLKSTLQIVNLSVKKPSNISCPTINAPCNLESP
jgi:hypothetical protein